MLDNLNNNKNSFLAIALRKDIVKRSLIVAAIVGTILNLINQGDAMNDFSRFELGKCILTYMVPYCVSVYGAVTALQHKSV
jgi:type III secretory pathway component EscS